MHDLFAEANLVKCHNFLVTVWTNCDCR